MRIVTGGPENHFVLERRRGAPLPGRASLRAVGVAVLAGWIALAVAFEGSFAVGAIVIGIIAPFAWLAYRFSGKSNALTRVEVDRSSGRLVLGVLDGRSRRTEPSFDIPSLRALVLTMTEERSSTLGDILTRLAGAGTAVHVGLEPNEGAPFEADMGLEGRVGREQVLALGRKLATALGFDATEVVRDDPETASWRFRRGGAPARGAVLVPSERVTAPDVGAGVDAAEPGVRPLVTEPWDPAAHRFAGRVEAHEPGRCLVWVDELRPWERTVVVVGVSVAGAVLGGIAATLVWLGSPGDGALRTAALAAGGALLGLVAGLLYVRQARQPVRWELDLVGRTLLRERARKRQEFDLSRVTGVVLHVASHTTGSPSARGELHTTGETRWVATIRLRGIGPGNSLDLVRLRFGESRRVVYDAAVPLAGMIANALQVGVVVEGE